MIQNNFTCIPYVLNNTYLSSIEVTTCGILKNWARDTIFQGISMECQKQGKDFWGEMEDKACLLYTSSRMWQYLMSLLCMRILTISAACI